MFEEWGLAEWLLLPLVIFSFVVFVWFLRRKVVRKFAEIEARQKFEARRKREARKLAESE